MSTANNVIKAGSLTRQSLSGVWLKNVFWRWRIYCILKADNRLELHSNKRSFINGHAPKSVLDLSTAVCICPAEYIRPAALLILTGSVHICLSSVSIADRDEWIAVLNGAAKSAIASNTTPIDNSNSQSALLTTVAPDGALIRQVSPGSSLYIRIWPVNVLPSTVTTSFQLHGRYWFAANNSEICVLPYASPAGPLLNVSFSTIRCCGGVGQTRVFFELGRQANTGEGTLWLQTISTAAADDMKRFLSEFLSKRDTLADGNKKSKKSDRLLANAGKVKHANNISSNESNMAPVGDEIAEQITTSASVLHPDTSVPTEKAPTVSEDRSYLEMGPPKILPGQDKKSLPFVAEMNNLLGSSKNKEVDGEIAHQNDHHKNFLELDFGIETAPSPHYENSQSASVQQQRQPESSNQRSLPKDSSTMSTATPPTNVKVKQQQLQIEKAEKTVGGGDYVVVCAPKGKPPVLHSKSQDSVTSATAASGSTDEDLAPFLADEFQGGASLPISSAVGNFKLEPSMTTNASVTASSGISSFVSPSFVPVQYASLQINTDEINNVTPKEEAVKPESLQRNTSSTSPTSQTLTSPQMSSVSVIYADLDFTSAPNRLQNQ